MIALMTLDALVEVIQLDAVGSWSRSVRLTTLAQMVGVGFLVGKPVFIDKNF